MLGTFLVSSWGAFRVKAEVLGHQVARSGPLDDLDKRKPKVSAVASGLLENRRFKLI